MSNISCKSIIKSITPPFVWALARYISICLRIIPQSARFVGEYATWEEASRLSTGYDDPSILEKVLKATLALVGGAGAVYERDSVLFDHIEYSWPLLAGLMWGAAMHGGVLRIVDFGGSLGSTYRQNKFFLDTLKEVSWNIVEQPHFVSCGQENFESCEMHFFNSIDDVLKTNKIDGILFCGVLQYLESPYDLLQSLEKYRFDYILVDRTPFSIDNQDKITIQHVPKAIYVASYPYRFLSEDRFLQAIGSAYRVVDWFVSELVNDSRFKGCILKRVTSKNHLAG
ncbi:methyltransferase, TIGR04325 family protein [Synergistales bacterium]|nr:methyltransferase, TIGR04325 family protein [Synergistales bacterium]